MVIKFVLPNGVFAALDIPSNLSAFILGDSKKSAFADGSTVFVV
jgi:hypothetical protein